MGDGRLFPAAWDNGTIAATKPSEKAAMNEAQAARIIELLESIDASLKRKNERAERQEANRINRPDVKPYVEAIQANIDSLQGRRMSAKEIAEAIGVEYDQNNQGHRLAFGHALTEAGAAKGKSGSARYYVFR